MAVNQKQIAERVGVSISLVSRVLSGNARDIGIAEETIKRVEEIATELGYVPNAAARTLKGKASNTIGVVVYDFQDPFFGSTIEQLQSIVHEQGYSLVLTGFQGRHPNESDLAPLHKHVIDGLVVLGSADRSEWLNTFSNMPVVRIGHGGVGDRGACIAIDEVDAAGQLLEHLLTRGVTRGLFLNSGLYAHGIRYAALERMAGRLGLSVERVSVADHGFAAGFQGCNQVLSGLGDSAALICATDMIAMGALHALHDAGVECPVTGFDDIPLAAQFLPSITTIRQPMEEIARQAIAAVVQSSSEVKTERLKGRLVVRASA